LQTSLMVVDVNQADPQSNAIHVAHNIPKDSDIKIVQTNPFNTTVHVSLNVGTGTKVKVMMTNARNVQLHVSFNGMGNSECDVELDTIFNSSVHLSFQNPKNTPVTLNMKNAELTHVHASQNVPQRSPMEVTIDGAKTCQIQIAQSVPKSSPLTWKLVGDPEENQIEVRQNAGDEASPLDCDPECPQEEYVYDYAYADSDSSHSAQDNEIAQPLPSKPVVKAAPPVAKTQSNPTSEYQYDAEEEDYQYPEYPADEDYQYEEAKAPEAPHEGFVVEDSSSGSGDSPSEGFVCPGGNLQTCVDICPGQFGANVFGACVLSCGRRCP